MDIGVFGQVMPPKLYMQIALFFPVLNPSLQPTIINTLSNGLERLAASFPWLAGDVVKEGSGESNPGTFKVKPLGKIPLVVKYLQDTASESMPTMDALRRANFPFSMLDENIICPRNTLPSPDASASETAPVFLVQATFIAGGLILSFLGQHNTMDMTGHGQVIDFFSKACHDEPFTNDELEAGNLPRRDLIPLLDDTYTSGSELSYRIMNPTPPSESPTPPPKSTWSYFTFSPASLTTLKSLATKSMMLSSGYISTDDTLSSFIWQSVTRARLPRLNSTSNSTFARAVDVRRYLDISPMYPGLLQNMTYRTFSLQNLVDEPLGGVASHLRAAVDPKTSSLKYDTCALATFFHRSDPLKKFIISLRSTIEPSSDIMLSSWAKLNCYSLDFNLGLGKPESVRRPRFTPFESLMYLMPKARDGEIAVAICLRNEDMERLRADEEFAGYARYVG